MRVKFEADLVLSLEAKYKKKQFVISEARKSVAHLNIGCTCQHFGTWTIILDDSRSGTLPASHWPGSVSVGLQGPPAQGKQGGVEQTQVLERERVFPAPHWSHPS